MQLHSESATVAGLYYDVAHSLRVRAWNLDGPGAWATVTTPKLKATFVPEAPRNVAAISSDGTLTVVWDAPDWDGGEPITSHVIRYRETGTTTWTESPTTSTKKSGSVTGLTNGTEYEAQVAATNTAGTGAWSPDRAVGSPNPASKKDASQLPGVPRLYEISARPASSSNNNAALLLLWAVPESSGGSSIYAYDWQYRLDGTQEWKQRFLNPHTSPDRISMTAPANTGVYETRIAARNDAGTGPFTDIIKVDVSVETTVTIDDMTRLLDAVSGDFGPQMPWVTTTVDFIKDNPDGASVGAVPLSVPIGGQVNNSCRPPAGRCILTQFYLNSEEDHSTAIHELAHAYTLVNTIEATQQRTLPILWLLATEIVPSESASYIGPCRLEEIVADLFQFTLIPGTTLTSYLTQCSDRVRDPTLQDRLTIIDILTGEVPQWFINKYGGDIFNRNDVFTSHYTGNIEAFWQDIIDLPYWPRKAIVQHLDRYFGGLCSLTATYSQMDLTTITTTNPWRCQ